MKIFIDASLIIYLNVRLPDHEARFVEEYWLDLLLNHTLYTNTLARMKLFMYLKENMIFHIPILLNS